ncbi:MAG: hypothetical protein KIT72_02340 [Polyangiaceae bacterium]|nr:hypothetical protein [Polyangiaceae bacterium]MCW5789237.1 hypothetical protein [Polyangiaceae bacterium]
MRRGVGRLAWCGTLAALGGLWLTQTGCTARIPRSLDGDLTRRVAPVPACVLRLPPQGKTSSASRSLREEQYWKLVFPSFDERRQELPENARDCAGRGVYDSPTLSGSRALRGWPFRIKEGDVVLGAGGSRLRLVWLRTQAFPDGTAGGALALVRTLPDHAEAYGVGVYRGPAERSKLRIERMGSEVIPTVQAEGCTEGEGSSRPCETLLHVFLPRQGQLKLAAQVPLERVGVARNAEPGMGGAITYRLSSSPKFEANRIRVQEQVVAEDSMGRMLRRAELERVFTLVEGELLESEPSLWGRVFESGEGG